MTVQIRRNVFETNSSSSHSVSYSSAHVAPIDFDSIRNQIGNREVSISFGGYGWGYEVLHSFDEKLSYVVTTLASGQYGMRATELEEMDQYKWLKEMLHETVGISLVIPNPELDDVGYIDHQSQGMLDDYNHWGNSKSTFSSGVCTLLFSDHISIIIDNDNH